MKKIGILGSTGSIGTQTLDIVKNKQDDFSVVAMSAYKNVKLLINQATSFKPKYLYINNKSDAEILNSKLKKIYSPKIFYNYSGLLEISSINDCDIFLNGLVGAIGLFPSINIIKSGTTLALANKESLVMSGQFLSELAKKNNVEILPVDSEHNAIWQCIQGENYKDIKRVILTGSGGPFRTLPQNEFYKITKKQALAHPNWEMGNKISIDSATMMNKGFEVIEAKWLFNLKNSQIDIIIHPQSIIHSLVEFMDCSVKAQLGMPDMKIPIQYALTYPHHINSDFDSLNLEEIGKLTFDKVDFNKFPCIELAYEAMKSGGSFPVVLNVANDYAVDLFLNDKIDFIQIPQLIEEALQKHPVKYNINMNDVEHIQDWTKEFILNRAKVKS